MRREDRLDPAPLLFDQLAPTYDEHFAVPFRRAYDTLAWELTEPLLVPGCRVIDVGCGVGRWAERLLDRGHSVVGIEPSPVMAAEARARVGRRPGCELVESGVEDAVLPEASAHLVLAQGSVQYATDPVGALVAMTGWLRPGGWVSVLVDGLVALCLELGRSGLAEEAADRALSGRGVWEQGERRAALRLFDRSSLAEAATAAGLVDVRVRGLLVGFSLLGREGVSAALDEGYEAQLARERAWAAVPALADLGKQLLLTARRPE